MKTRLLWVPILLVAMTVQIVSAASYGYATISQPFSNVYRQLDPKSSVVKTARQGEQFELAAEPGDAWCKVNVGEGETGWIELAAVTISQKPAFMVLGMPGGPLIAIIVFLILAGGGIGFYIVRMSKQTVDA